MNQGVRADFLLDQLPDFGQCSHKVSAHHARRGLLYQQNHCGVYRSEPAGENCQDITEGLPSQFGFVLGPHSQDPDTLFVRPDDQVLGQDVRGGQRYVSEAEFRVYRSRNNGDNWELLMEHLEPILSIECGVAP